MRAAMLCAVLAGLCACTTPEPTSSAPEAPAALTPVADGVYVHRGRLEDWGPANEGDVSNAGVVVGTRCVAVIDTGGTVATGRRLHAALRRVSSLPVCYVINTHAHPDHVLGNRAFIDAAKTEDQAPPQVVGHARLPAALAARGPYYLRALRRDFSAQQADPTQIVAPTVLVQDTLVLDLGGRSLALKAWPTAHTDADLSVLDERTRTLFLGDLLFVDHAPVVDGRLKGWLTAMGTWRTWSVARVVPGHGAPSADWPGALDPQQRYLETLQADVRQALKQGLTLSQAVAQIRPDRPDWRLLDVFHARNVTAAYAELEWED